MNATVLEVAKTPDAPGNHRKRPQVGRARRQVGGQAVGGISVYGPKHLSSGGHCLLGKQADGIAGALGHHDIADQTNCRRSIRHRGRARGGRRGGFAWLPTMCEVGRKDHRPPPREVATPYAAFRRHGARAPRGGALGGSQPAPTELPSSPGQALHSIVGLWTPAPTMCAPSPPAAEQQSSTIEEINRYVDYINRISNEMRGQ